MEPASVVEADEIRTRVHGMWASVAGRWGEHADYVDARGASVTAKMLELTDPHAGERVLELACGAGGVGLAAAERVGPEGEVVLSDVVAEMTSIAAARAESRGLTNVRTCVLDLEQIEQPDGSYDVVLCREGLMFAPDPARAAREIRRVLRPGGRVALAVWGPRERNPWLGVVLDAVSAQIGAPVPPPGVPGPFSLGDADRVAELLVRRRVGGRRRRRARNAPTCRLVRGMVDEDVGARRAAREHALRRCPRMPHTPFTPACTRRSASTKRPPDWSSPASTSSPRGTGGDLR